MSKRIPKPTEKSKSSKSEMRQGQANKPERSFEQMYPFFQQTKQKAMDIIEYTFIDNVREIEHWRLLDQLGTKQTPVIDYPSMLFESPHFPIYQWKNQTLQLSQTLDEENVRDCFSQVYTYLLWWCMQSRLTPRFRIVSRVSNAKSSTVGILVDVQHKYYESRLKLIVTSLLKLISQFRTAKLSQTSQNELKALNQGLSELSQKNIEDFQKTIQESFIGKNSRLVNMEKESKITHFSQNLKDFLKKCNNQMKNPSEYFIKNIKHWFPQNNIDINNNQFRVTFNNTTKMHNKTENDNDIVFRISIQPQFIKIVLLSNFASCAQHNDIIAIYALEIKRICPEYNIGIEYNTTTGKYLVGIKAQIMFKKCLPSTPEVVLGHLTRAIDINIMAFNTLNQINFYSNTLNLNTKVKEFEHYIHIYRKFSSAIVECAN